MGPRKMMRTCVLALTMLGVVGAFAVVACAPSSPAVLGQAGGTGDVSKSVSVSATEAPLVLPQSGDGDGTGGHGESTEEPTAEPTGKPTPTQYVPPTADPSECVGSGAYRSCPPDGDPKVQFRVRQNYNRAMRQNEANGLRGDAREFPELDVIIKAHTVSDVDEVVEFLEENGVDLSRSWSITRDSDTDYGEVSGYLNLDLLPGLVALEGVERVYENLSEVGGESESFGASSYDLELLGAYQIAREESRARVARGEGEYVEPKLRVLIETETADAVDEVVRYVKSREGENIVWNKVEPSDGDPDGSGTVEVNIAALPVTGLGWFPGVERVSEAKKSSASGGGAGPGSRGNIGRDAVEPPSLPTPTATPSPAAVFARADQWHRAGFTGSGVEVAILDRNFDGFTENVLPLLSEPVHYFCYGGLYDNVAEGILHPDGTEIDLDGDEDTDFFNNCELSSRGSSRHGTAAALSLLEIAPSVKLHVTNVNDGTRRALAMNWLTDGVEDNEIIDLPYRRDKNDFFDVKVISHSVGSRWDGPGDGSSPFIEGDDRSLLHTVNDSVDEDVLWVNAAGNDGAVTWFKYDPTFTSGNPRLLDFSGSGDTCNEVDLRISRPYSFQLRWWDSWLGANTNLDVLLYPKSGSVSNPLGEDDGVEGGQDVQSGAASDHPYEFLRVLPYMLPSGEYCLAVVLRSSSDSASSSGSRSVVEPPSEGVSVLEWVQFQVWASPDTDFLSSVTTMGSLTNPAESTNDGMLSVGFTDSFGGVDVRSARGPGPWPRDRQTLDLVSDGTNPFSPSSEDARGSSGSAPRVAGLAALVNQALGSRGEYDEPEELARFLKNHARVWFQEANIRYGHGVAGLPPLDAPEDVVLHHMQCDPRSNVVLSFGEVAVRHRDGVPEKGDHSITIELVGDDTRELDFTWNLSDSGRFAGVEGGTYSGRYASIDEPGTYQATVKTCLLDEEGNTLLCGLDSIPSQSVSKKGLIGMGA